jgi:putative cell wall-binding protein
MKATTASSRIGGSDRYATSALIATRFGTANAVIIANGSTAKNGADALSANYLAGRKSAPILLTEAAGVSPAVLTAEKKVFAGATDPTVYVIGGLDSVSDAALAQVKSAAASVASGTVTVSRIAGADRYATSALTVAAAGTSSGEVRLASSVPVAATAFLASGEVNADALSAGPVSNAWGLPLLLTGSQVLPTTVAKSIAAHKIKQLIVLGGADRVSSKVLDQAKAAGVTTIKRIAGSNRFDTAARLYTLVSDTALDAAGLHYASGSGGTGVYVANGLTGFPDALSVGPLAGRNQDVLLTVGSGALPSPTAAFLNAHKASLDTVTALGRGATVSDAVLAAAASSIG